MADARPFLIKAITDMLKGASAIPGIAKRLDPFKEPFITLLRKVRPAAIDPPGKSLTPSDIECTNTLFEFVCRGYAIFVSVYYPVVGREERELLLDVEGLAACIENFHEIADFALVEFCTMVRQYGDNASSRYRGILCARPISQVLAICQQPQRSARVMNLGTTTLAVITPRTNLQ
jgi:hypothetical protein